MLKRLHVKCPLFLSDFNETSSSGSRVVASGRMDGETDVMKQIVAFRNFANAPKMGQVVKCEPSKGPAIARATRLLI